MIATTEEGEAIVTPVNLPPSLRHRGPARLDLTLRSGLCPEIRRGQVHVRKGWTLIVRIVPPTPDARIEITSDSPLAVVVQVHRVEGGSMPIYHAELIGHTRGSPLPASTKLRVVIVDKFPQPCRLTIPVTIWPSSRTLLTWWLFAYVGIIGLRWQNMVAHGETVGGILSQLGNDLPFSLLLLFLGSFLLIPLRIFGWFWTISAPEEDDQ